MRNGHAAQGSKGAGEGLGGAPVGVIPVHEGEAGLVVTRQDDGVLVIGDGSGAAIRGRVADRRAGPHVADHPHDHRMAGGDLLFQGGK